VAKLDLDEMLAQIASEIAKITYRGRVADYIPPLADVSLDKFGMAVCTADGTCARTGDAEEGFSIQSVSKIFALTLALQHDAAEIWQRVGREPSGTPFNSIVQLESEHGIPRNPFINAGAIVIADILTARYGAKGVQAKLLALVRDLSGRDVTGEAPVSINEATARAEKSSGHRNVALAQYMRVFGNIRHDVEETLDAYFHQCALTMSCTQLARAGRYLMMEGVNPVSRHVIATAAHNRLILALMMMCGHYDASGNFAIKVGLPGKSGVGGGILAIAPRIASVAVWSPGLCAAGNSLLGTYALERLVQMTGWTVFS